MANGDNEDLLKEAQAKEEAKKKEKADKAKKVAADLQAKAAAEKKKFEEQKKSEEEANKRNAENRKKASEERAKKEQEQKANREKANKAKAELDKKNQLDRAYSEARAKAFAAAERFARTGNPNDLKIYDNANAAYQVVRNNYKNTFGYLPGNEPALPAAPNRREFESTNTPTPNPQNVGNTTNVAANPKRDEYRNPVVGAAAMTTTDPYLKGIIEKAAKSGIDLTIAQAQAQLDAGGGTGTGGGGGGTTRSFTQYTMQQVRSAADNIFQQSIGRSLNDEELRQLHASLNGALKASPTVSTVSGSTQMTSGGVDERGFIEQQAQMNPEFANYQMGTTYFDAMLKSLSGPVGGGI